MTEDHKSCQGKTCAIEATIKLLQPKWTLQIVYELQKGKQRFNELAGNLGGVNPRTLCQRLRELEDHGIVERTILQTIPPWVEYSLTDKGSSLSSVVESIEAWGRDWVQNSPSNQASTSA